MRRQSRDLKTRRSMIGNQKYHARIVVVVVVVTKQRRTKNQKNKTKKPFWIILNSRGVFYLDAKKNS